MKCHPHLYEVNARIFIKRISDKYCRKLTLTTVPEEEWQLLRSKGFDLIWFMGVWQNSPGSRQRALSDLTLRKEFAQALQDWTDDDITGSPYAIYSYNLDTSLGKPEGLLELKSKLDRHGLGLILDFVPNHFALDHPWTFYHPEWFVQGRKEVIISHPDWFFSRNGNLYLAHGRDPYFLPWTDTVQVNFYSNELRQAMINELLQIAEVADGVRCDMAMLALNSVFEQVWGEIVKDYLRPQTEFWTDVIESVKRRRPDFIFIAEVYWGLERKLQQIGFDFTYDKLLYELLRFSSPNTIRDHLMVDDLYQWRSVRFIENHDEPRAVTAFGCERSLAAAAVIATIPGLRFFHNGQLEGSKVRLPIQLVREPKEVDDPVVTQFYQRLLAVCGQPAFHNGKWTLIKPEGTESHQNLLIWSWCYEKQFKIVVINYSQDPAQACLKLPSNFENVEKVVLRDELTNMTYIRDSREVRSNVVYVDLGPWCTRILNLTAG